MQAMVTGPLCPALDVRTTLIGASTELQELIATIAPDCATRQACPARRNPRTTDQADHVCWPVLNPGAPVDQEYRGSTGCHSQYRDGIEPLAEQGVGHHGGHRRHQVEQTCHRGRR